MDGWMDGWMDGLDKIFMRNKMTRMKRIISGSKIAEN